jgi:hypothetical protein
MGWWRGTMFPSLIHSLVSTRAEEGSPLNDVLRSLCGRRSEVMLELGTWQVSFYVW